MLCDFLDDANLKEVFKIKPSQSEKEMLSSSVKFAHKEEPDFNSLMQMISDYKNKHSVVDISCELKDHLILKYKILQIHEIKKDLFTYRNKRLKLISESPSELIKPLSKIMLEIGIAIPDDVTKAEIDAYDYNKQKRKENESYEFYNCLMDYEYFNNWITCKVNHDNSFENLIELYNTDKFNFYVACIKSRFNNDGFYTFIGNYRLKLNFQTDKFDETYQYYMKGIYNLRYSIKIMNQALRKIKINNSSLQENANLINISFDEHYDLVYGDLYGSYEKDVFSKKNISPAGSYWHCENVINIYYNQQVKPCKKKDTRIFFHEFGHFVNDSYDDMAYRNKLSETLESFVRKDCKLAVLNKRVLRYGRYSNYYKYSAPSLNILQRKGNDISRESFAKELFAETVAHLLVEKSIKKRRRKDPKFKHVHNMFHHTTYLVKQILKGKGVNKYKCLKK